VATGAVLGSALGVAMPLLLHGHIHEQEQPGAVTLQVTGGPGGAVISGRF
jgi:hypothetical protein